MQPVLPWQLPDGTPTPSMTSADLQALRDHLESSWVQGEAQLRGAPATPGAQGDTRAGYQPRLGPAVIHETGRGSLLLLRAMRIDAVRVDEVAPCAPEPIPRVTPRPQAIQALRALLEALSQQSEGSPSESSQAAPTLQAHLKALRREAPALGAPVNLTSLGALLGIQADLTRLLWREGPERRARLADALTRQVCALMRQAEDEVIYSMSKDKSFSGDPDGPIRAEEHEASSRKTEAQHSQPSPLQLQQDPITRRPPVDTPLTPAQGGGACVAHLVNRQRPGLRPPRPDQALLIRAGWLGLRALLGARADRALLDEARLQQSARRAVLHAGLDPKLPAAVLRQNEAALPGLLRTSAAVLISGLRPEVTLLGPVVNLAHLRAQHQANQGRSGPGQTQLGRSAGVSLSVNLLSLSWPGSRRMRPLETRPSTAPEPLQ